MCESTSRSVSCEGRLCGLWLLGALKEGWGFLALRACFHSTGATALRQGVIMA